MGLLFDTSILVAVERGDEIDEFATREDTVGISVITVAEYWKGVERAATSEQRDERVAFFLDIAQELEIVNIDQQIALRTARVWAEQERIGERIPAHDLLIAATALERGWPLVTADLRDFKRVQGLEVIEVALSR